MCQHRSEYWVLKRVLEPHNDIALNSIDVGCHIDSSIGHQNSIYTVKNILPNIDREYNQSMHPIATEHVLKPIDCQPSPWWFQQGHQRNGYDNRTSHPSDIDASFSDHDNPEQDV